MSAYKWRVAWHDVGCFGSTYYEREEDARREADRIAAELGDAKAWRDGVCGVSVAACCVVKPNDYREPQSGA